MREPGTVDEALSQLSFKVLQVKEVPLAINTHKTCLEHNSSIQLLKE